MDDAKEAEDDDSNSILSHNWLEFDIDWFKVTSERWMERGMSEQKLNQFIVTSFYGVM